MHQKNAAFPIIIVLAVLLPLLSQTGYSQTATTYTPDFSMGLAEFQEKVLTEKEEIWVIDFWASWCGPCIRSMPHMKELHTKYKDQGVRFISVSWDRKEANWRRMLDRLQLPWQQIIVPRGEEDYLNTQFPHKGIPTAFVIYKDGKSKKVNDVYNLEKVIAKAMK